DYTMERVVEVARKLREDHDFRGYIHLKTIPEASQDLIDQAGEYADRISINVELPKQESLDKLAPEKNIERTQKAMGGIRYRIEENKERRKSRAPEIRKERPFSPAGQSTQMIVGADGAKDQDILQRSTRLYDSYRLRRVYYSAFSPIPDASPVLPLSAPPLIREHRLYQADWLMRFYQFSVEEIVPADTPDLDLEIDPKLAWALRNRHRFPIDLNKASRSELLRIPGIGTKTVARLLKIRRYADIRLLDLKKLRVSIKKVLPFIITADHHSARSGLDSDRLRASLVDRPASKQLDLFSDATVQLRTAKTAAISGQL
ncbi:MAG: putative DNA modification/repair radical SAM protein, partial [Verrucomicrobiales bacterium]|nr:putative DNA modification/repair radical SAM protein [Verrucomicrobiales bacterium]